MAGFYYVSMGVSRSLVLCLRLFHKKFFWVWVKISGFERWRWWLGLCLCLFVKCELF